MSGLLARLPLFSGLAPEQLGVLAAGSRLSPQRKGEILFHQGDPVRGFFSVLSGQMQLTVSTADGSEKVVEIVAAGESFGEAVVFEGLRYPVTATALVGTELLAVSGEAVLALLDRDPAFARRMLANMAIRLRRLVRDVESYSLRSGVQRVIGFLLHEADADGPAAAPGARECTVLLPARKHVVASRLNLAPETLSRVLRMLAAEGLVSVAGRRIVLHDVPGLAARLAWQ
ncbi:Crp/Fnr family transcriptional regulator [Streptomyces sp. SB3404]|uniref:Crp/Fnr family transcriptional regulator n=1 Tax=Streptomyces boncukensis TaxID=2711219 RepID=A0A6G4X6I1_9ACTN|nr:Crp/Fnr family transcriptional regulator [Streptomyces boncukensis]